ncbi:DUF1217 domain-containing protein [Cohaesibacter celericrescens]|jgi:hypothetical protein|uniref:Flagellar biosynthesis protein FlgF n=1 Tax=Cohaesibacter celericrescens TaxID=2067669 RepID=A0A2N5XWM8_9HYPH|nr:DUF1217 domain-containing protein [Cohaesibacter celericrescens]PLW75503.1 flagellar biosynthesis protein FlgF [Cohaesibacter celericrescens]PLW78910.1 flagellar biosynthesis protein FlgF [Cohaesibacter celericrescens]
MIDTSLRLTMLNNNMSKSLDTVSKDPLVDRLSQNYLEKIQDIKTVDEFIDDYEVFSFAMKAMGLEDMTYAKAYMRKVLVEGVSDSDSFANQITDERFKAFAETFNFEQFGETTTTFSKTQQPIVDMYVRQTLEDNEGEDNTGVKLALYFQRKASTITTSMELLADNAMAEVARTLAGIPSEAAGADLDLQASMIDERINIEDLQDPDKVKEMLVQFSALWDLENGTATQTVPNVLISDPLSAGIDQDLLMSLQGLRLGGV